MHRRTLIMMAKSTHVINASMHSMAHRGTFDCVEAEHWDAHHTYHACKCVQLHM